MRFLAKDVMGNHPARPDGPWPFVLGGRASRPAIVLVVLAVIWGNVSLLY